MLRVPLGVRRAMYRLTLRATVGDFTRFGLPRPDHKFYETHPIVNSLLVYYVGQGDIEPKPDVARLERDGVVFVDGSRAEVDVVLLCTGYLVRFDFLDADAHLGGGSAHPRLGLHLFTPTHDNLFVAGLIQPDSGQWCIAHWQAQLLASYIRVRADRPAVAADFFAEVSAAAAARFTGGTRYAGSTRHHFEIAHQDYLAELERAIHRLAAA